MVYNVTMHYKPSRYTDGGRKAKGSNMEQDFNQLERLARAAKEANSFRDYIAGTATEELNSYIAEAEETAAEAVKRLEKLNAPADRVEKVNYLLEKYKTKIYQWLIDYYNCEAFCPSIMISGGGNFPTRRKEKQNARRESIRENSPQYLIEKIKGIGYNAIEIRSDDANAVERIKEKIETLKAKPDPYGNKKAEIRRLKGRLLELAPDEMKQGKEITINGKEATYQNIVSLFDGIKPHASRYGGESYYINFPLIFSDGKRKYSEFVDIETDPNGGTVSTYGNAENNYKSIFLPLTDDRKFNLIISRISGSGNKAVIYSILKDLAPKAEQAATEAQADSNLTINGEPVTVERNSEIMRLQIFFEGIPQPETRQQMKSNGFVWSPSNKAWQRMLNSNAEYALKRLLTKAGA